MNYGRGNGVKGSSCGGRGFKKVCTITGRGIYQENGGPNFPYLGKLDKR